MPAQQSVYIDEKQQTKSESQLQRLWIYFDLTSISYLFVDNLYVNIIAAVLPTRSEEERLKTIVNTSLWIVSHVVKPLTADKGRPVLRPPYRGL